MTQSEINRTVIVQPFVEDEFFPESQSSRLRELMQRWRECRDTGTSLADSEQSELDSLIEAELLGATNCAAALAAEPARGLRSTWQWRSERGKQEINDGGATRKE